MSFMRQVAERERRWLRLVCASAVAGLVAMAVSVIGLLTETGQATVTGQIAFPLCWLAMGASTVMLMRTRRDLRERREQQLRDNPTLYRDYLPRDGQA